MERLAQTLEISKDTFSFDRLEHQADEVLDAIIVHPEDGETLVWASADERYRYAFFGRDSIRMASDLLTLDDDAATNTALEIMESVVKLQYLKEEQPQWWRHPIRYRRFKTTVEASEAEDGRFAHEHRARMFGRGVVADEVSLAIMHRLASARGGDDNSMTDYGTVDAQGLLLSAYNAAFNWDWSKKGDERRGRTQGLLKHRSGRKRTLLEGARAAREWILRRVQESDNGLIETIRTDERRRIESWKDSLTSHLHLDGSLPNGNVASIEDQGGAYSGLRTYLDDTDETWQENLKHSDSMLYKIVGRFWMPEKNYFAVGLDKDEAGKPRQIQTITANAGMLLEHDVFNSENDYLWPYLEGIVRTLFSDGMLCDGGIRSRSIEHKDLIPFADLHGSLVTWPMETHAIAKGLYKQGFHRLAAELWTRMLASLEVSGHMQEFNYFDAEGCQLLPHQEHDIQGRLTTLRAETYPQKDQGWTASAVKSAAAYLKRMQESDDIGMRIIPEERTEGHYERYFGDTTNGWVVAIENDILRGMTQYRHHPEKVVETIRTKAKPYRIEKVTVNSLFEVIL